MRALALILPLISAALAATALPGGARFVLAHVLSLDPVSGAAELAVSGHGLPVGARSYVLTEAREGLEIEILAVDKSTTEVRFLGGLQRRVKEGDRLTLYCGEITSPTQTTTPDHLPLPEVPAEPQVPLGSSELELFLREQQLQVDVLRAEIAAAALAEATAEEGEPEGWQWHGQARAGGELEHNVDFTPLGLDTSDPQQALDDLDERLAEAAPIVQQSGSESARAYLDEALQLRNEAATLLSSDPELAVLLVQLAAFNIDEALRAAGAPVPPEASRRMRDDDLNFFAENTLFGERRTASGGRVSLQNRLRTTDRYRRVLLDLGLASSPLSTVGWGLRPEVDWYNYEPGSSDDSLNLRLDGELFRDLLASRRLRLTAAQRAYYRREYNGNGDDGYATLKGFLEGRYRLADFQSTALRYTAAAQRYNRDANAPFDYDGHELSWSWERFGPSASQFLEAEVEQRDYNKPEDEDDFVEARLTDRFSLSLARAVTLYQDATLARRVHRETGQDNSDYQQLQGRAGIDLRPNRRVALALEYGLDAVRYDAERLDAVQKEQGDFDAHRYETRLDLGPWKGWELLLEGGFERRRYARGETGQFETWLSADFSPIADYDRTQYSATLQKDLSSRARATLSFSHTDDAFLNYSQYDNQRELYQLQVTVRY